MSTTRSGSLEVQELSPQMLEALLGRQPCDHSQRLPLMKVGNRWCCDRCVGDAERELSAEQQTWFIREANPLVFAPELIERARGGVGLTMRELEEVRRRPTEHLRRAGLGQLLA